MFKNNEPLALHTTLKVGGPAEHFIDVTSEAELAQAVQSAKENGLPFKILGGGSNLLVPDAGVNGLVIKNSISKDAVLETDDTVQVTIGAGQSWDTFVAECVENGWWGVENLSHIPGTVGAVPVQNVGAYGVEVKDVIKSVRIYNTDTLEFTELSAGECSFGYRDSIFKTTAGQSYIVTAVTFVLSTQPQPQLDYKDLQETFADTAPSLTEIREAIIAIRSKKFPDWHKVGTAGSFFKNPIVSSETFVALKETYPELPGYALPNKTVKLPLGWILDKVLNLKGIREGAVGTYEGQALVLVNEGGATATGITQFAENIVAQVKEKIGIEVEWEVTRW